MPVSRVVLRRVAAAFATWSLAAALIGCSTPEAAVQPQKTAVDALPNGIAVRPADGAVFITDDRTNSVLASTGGAFTPYASIPLEAGQGKSLSQLSFARSGALPIWIARATSGNHSSQHVGRPNLAEPRPSSE